MIYKLYTCAECPFLQEGQVEDEFYCKNPKADKAFAKSTLDPFDGVPEECPIREEDLTLEIG